MTTIDPDATDADDGTTTPERLRYSGMTNTTVNDGTAATDTDIAGDGPTGKETAEVERVVEDGDTDLIERLQPGTAEHRE